jgi:hypothetical protein
MGMLIKKTQGGFKMKILLKNVLLFTIGFMTGYTICDWLTTVTSKTNTCSNTTPWSDNPDDYGKFRYLH